MYELCALYWSAMIPCNGGTMAPPKIIMINRDEPLLVCSPKPPIDNEKIHGHITEQNNPPLIKDNNATLPVLNNPTSIITTAALARYNRVRAASSPEMMKRKMANKT